MNRLFFRPEHAGMTKTDAAAQTLGETACIMQCIHHRGQDAPCDAHATCCTAKCVGGLQRV